MSIDTRDIRHFPDYADWQSETDHVEIEPPLDQRWDIAELDADIEQPAELVQFAPDPVAIQPAVPEIDRHAAVYYTAPSNEPLPTSVINSLHAQAMAEFMIIAGIVE